MNEKMQFSFWNTGWTGNQPDWFQNQNQYMDAWSSFQQSMSNSSFGVPPMAEAMNSWWNSASPSLSDQNYDFFSKMVGQGQVFHSMGEQFSKLLEGMNEVNSQSGQWQGVLNDQFASMKSMFEGMPGSFANSPFIMGGLDAEQFNIAEMTSFIEKLLSVPGVGPNRETQAQMQEGIKLLNEYQQVFSEYKEQLNKVGVEALETMRLRILEMGEQGKEIKSLREIYDLWIDCNEKAYAELVYTDEYSELYGRLTNVSLAVKQHQGKVIDKFLAKLNMPTRQGMNTFLKRVQEMKRDQSKSTAKIIALEKELQALYEMVEGGKESSSLDASSTVTTKKTARKKTARKKTVKKEVVKRVSKKASKKIAKKVAKKSSANKPIIIDI